jgi:membrane-bound lytic murein transglycosylase B
MKKFIQYAIYLALVFVMTLPISAYSQNTGEVKTDSANAPISVRVAFRDGLVVERTIPHVEIIPGESEYDKREHAKKAASARRTVARERGSDSGTSNISLDQLRELYQRAASKFGIDWRLIEAVHQVETGKLGNTCKRNPSGATGPMQFMPSTFRTYANEGNDICSVSDSVFAAANLLATSGADRGDIDAALYSYNHSRSYVEKVKEIMSGI